MYKLHGVVFLFEPVQIFSLHSSEINKYTANVYRDSAGKSECRDFKFMGIACIPAIKEPTIGGPDTAIML